MSLTPHVGSAGTLTPGGGDAGELVNGTVLSGDWSTTGDFDVTGDLRVKGGTPHFDIAAFGEGVGQGTAAVDTAAAVDALAAAGSAKGVVFSDRPLLISSELTIPNFAYVEGVGEAALFTATGNHYIFGFSPGNRSGVRNVTVDAASSQSSGGAFDFTDAGSNVRIKDIYLANNLHTGFNIAPDESVNGMKITGIRWNGVSGCNTAIKLGGGGALIANAFFDDLDGVAAVGGMDTWIDATASALVDTIKVHETCFYRGRRGIAIGTSTIKPTNLKFVDVTVDSMTEKGCDIQGCFELEMRACEISSCGSSTIPGLHFGAGAVLSSYHGAVQNCQGDGIWLSNGSRDTEITGRVCDNNQANAAFLRGIVAFANTSKFNIHDIVIANGNRIPGAAGHQKIPIEIAAGTSDGYMIHHVTAYGHDTSNAVSDGGTGVNKVVSNNLAL